MKPTDKTSNRKKKKGKDDEKEKTKTEEKGDPNNLLMKLATQHHKKSRLSLSGGEEVGDRCVRIEGEVINGMNLAGPQGTSQGDAELPEWFEDLNADNEDAFKELFDMLDSAKTGTLNADTMYEGLKRVDSGITKEEVQAVINKLDKDGNGEIDFDEFLIHMTQGDFAGESVDDGSSKKKFSRRQRLFLTAITQFSVKNTLEMEKKIHQPHVISHYTAGVRLEGLTDRQLARQMRKLQKNAKQHNSPYAKPLPFVTQSSNKNTRTNKYKSTQERTEEGTINVTIPIPMIQTETPERSSSWKANWQLFASRNSVLGKPEEVLFSKLRSRLRKNANMKKINIKKIFAIERPIPQFGKVRVPLPVLKVKYIKKRPTIDDLPNIREKATYALNDYYHKLRAAAVKNAYEHWDTLYADTIRPKKLLDNFRTVYRAYSPHKEEEAFVVCPWIPGPNPYFQKTVTSHIRPFSA